MLSNGQYAQTDLEATIDAEFNGHGRVLSKIPTVPTGIMVGGNSLEVSNDMQKVGCVNGSCLSSNNNSMNNDASNATVAITTDISQQLAQANNISSIQNAVKNKYPACTTDNNCVAGDKMAAPMKGLKGYGQEPGCWNKDVQSMLYDSMGILNYKYDNTPRCTWINQIGYIYK
jgi:hypothetical protein